MQVLIKKDEIKIKKRIFLEQRHKKCCQIVPVVESWPTENNIIRHKYEHSGNTPAYPSHPYLWQKNVIGIREVMTNPLSNLEKFFIN